MPVRIALVVAPVVALLVYYALVSGQLPAQLPMQWNSEGGVNWTASPGYALAFLLIMIVFLDGVFVAAGRARSARLQDQNLGLAVMLDMAAAYNFCALVSFQLVLEMANAAPFRLGLTPGKFVAGTFVGTAVMITYVCVRVMRADSAAGPREPRNELEALWSDPENWRYRVYYCKQDPRLLVPKRRIQIGGTFNFAHPAAIPITALLLIVPVGVGLACLKAL